MVQTTTLETKFRNIYIICVIKLIQNYSMLSQLSSLDMGWNFDLSSEKVLLQFTELSQTSLVRNLTSLEHLDLTLVNISSTVPNIFANLSTLTSLHLNIVLQITQENIELILGFGCRKQTTTTQPSKNSSSISWCPKQHKNKDIHYTC